MSENCVLVSDLNRQCLSPLMGVELTTHPMTGLCMAGARQTVGQFLLCLGRADW
jgi:hypothetical protein